MANNIAVISARRRRRNAGGSAAPVLLHTFTGADSAVTMGNADTGQAPTVIQHGGAAAGIFGRQSNRAYLANVNAATDYTFGYFDAAGSGDFIAEWDFPGFLAADLLQSTGGVFSGVDPTHVFIWDINNNGTNGTSTISFYKDIGAGFVSLGAASSAFDFTVVGTLQVARSGTTITAKWNGSQIAQYTSISDNLAGTKFGLSHSAALRAVRCETLRVYR